MIAGCGAKRQALGPSKVPPKLPVLAVCKPSPGRGEGGCTFAGFRCYQQRLRAASVTDAHPCISASRCIAAKSWQQV